MTTRKLKVQYYPAFETAERLQEQLPRACWYLDALEPQTIVVPTSLANTGLELANFYDPSIADIYTQMVDAGVLVFCSPDEVKLEDADVIVCWQGKELLGDKLKKLEAKGIQVFNVNRTHRMEGSLYIEIVNKVCGGQEEAIRYGREKFNELSELHKNTQSAFLFCTGPSIAEYDQYQYADGVSIVCNSVILDHDLMDYVRPSLHVFADPIFHFGCSTYASEFRRSLVEASTKYNLTHIIPLKYWSLFKYQFPELVDCSFPIPFDQAQPVNYSLETNFLLKTTDNILTFLMLPLAGSLASRIYILGCDGRPLSEDDYFWNHNDKTQIVDEMDSIQLAHPSFFKLDYNEYYVRHCERLEEYFQAGEQLGKRFVSLSFSHIPALISREYEFRFASSNDSLFVSLNPDLVNGFGHFYHMDRRVHERLEPGIGFVSLGHDGKDTDKELADVLPTFSQNTWQIRHVGSDVKKIEQKFGEELVGAAISIRRLSMVKHMYMYTTDIAHLGVVLENQRSFAASNIHFHLNLFYSSFDIFADNFSESAICARYADVFQQFLSLSDLEISLYVESPVVQQRLQELFGITTKLWPMMAVSATDTLASAAAARKPKDRPMVLFPGTTQFAKGADVACEAILRYNETFGGEVDFVLRDMLRDRPSANAQLQVMLDAVSSYDNVTLVHGAVSDEDYANLYANADVVVIPYRRDSFYARTSAAVVDALFFGCPVIVADDTWLSWETKKFDQHYTFDDGDDYSLVRAIRSALSNQRGDPQNSTEHRAHWQERYGAHSLISAFGSRSTTLAPVVEVAPSSNAEPAGAFTVQARSLYKRLEDAGEMSLQEQINAMREELLQLTQTLLGTSSKMSDITKSVAQNNDQVAARFDKADKVVGGLADSYKLLEANKESIGKIKQSLNALDGKHTELDAHFGAKLAEIGLSLDANQTNLDVNLETKHTELSTSFDAKLAEQEKKMDEFELGLTQVKAVAVPVVTNRDLYQRFKRDLDRSDLEVFVEEWAPKLNLELGPRVLAYEAELICETERRCAGRLASSIQDALLRSLVARAVVGTKLEYLEIGTLFGINLCTVHELSKHEFSDMHLTSIDPLDNYYQQGRDVLTGLPINFKLVQENVLEMKIPADRIRFIQHLSTDEEAVSMASEHVYNCMLIDGDHSYEGVKYDFEYFSGMLCSGGYLMVDDYEATEWPDVTRYVDETIKKDPRFEFVGSQWRTAVFRAI